MGKRILIVLGHPHDRSLCGALAEAYGEGARTAGAETRVRTLAGLSFDPVTPPYGTESELEPDLRKFQEDLAWAEHVVLVYPNWWGGAPGPFKSLLERVLLPGFAFKYHSGDSGWDRLLSGRTGETIVTMDTPPVLYKVLFGAAGDRVIARRTLDFCGIKPIRATRLGPVRSSSPEKRASWLERSRTLGRRAAA